MTNVPPNLTKQNYVRRFMDAGYWRPYVRMVCRRHDLPAELVQAGFAGTFPTFVVDERYVVKFFGPLFNGEHVYEVEAEALAIAGGKGLLAPKLVAHGGLYADDGDWPWPYLIMRYIPGVAWRTVYDETSPQERVALAHELGGLVRRLHNLSLEDARVLRPSWDAFAGFLRERLERCRTNHAEWGSLPEHMLPHISDYLPSLNELVPREGQPSLLHADVTEDHVLGERRPTWRTTGLIDYGDARVGDPAYELVALHLGCFQHNKAMLRTFLKRYTSEAAQREALIQRAKAYTLLHQFNVLEPLHRKYPEIVELDSLTQLMDMLWEPDIIGLEAL